MANPFPLADGGDDDGSPYRPDSPRLIPIARRGGYGMRRAGRRVALEPRFGRSNVLKEQAIPLSLIAALRLAETGDGGIGVALRLYPIYTDNLVTKFQGRFATAAECEAAWKYLLTCSGEPAVLRKHVRRGRAGSERGGMGPCNAPRAVVTWGRKDRAEAMGWLAIAIKMGAGIGGGAAVGYLLSKTRPCSSDKCNIRQPVIAYVLAGAVLGAAVAWTVLHSR